MCVDGTLASFDGELSTMSYNVGARGGGLFSTLAANVTGFGTGVVATGNTAALHGDNYGSPPVGPIWLDPPTTGPAMPGQPLCSASGESGCVVSVADAYGFVVVEPVVVELALVGPSPVGATLVGPSFVLVSGGQSSGLDLSVGLDASVDYGGTEAVDVAVGIRLAGSRDPWNSIAVTSSRCNAGYGLPDGASACEPCAPGSNSPSPSMTACQPCEEGYFTLGPGSATCDACRPGYGAPDDDDESPVCNRCPGGTFSANATVLGVGCTACADGLGTDGDGASVCDQPLAASSAITVSSTALVVTISFALVFSVIAVVSCCKHRSGRHGVIATAGLSSYDVVTDGTHTGSEKLFAPRCDVVFGAGKSCWCWQ